MDPKLSILRNKLQQTQHMTSLTVSKFKKALEGTGGVQAVIAKACGVDRSTVTRFIQKYPKMRLLLDAEAERIIDIAENKLHALVNDKDIRAIKFFLETKGKSRGYVSKQELEIAGNISTLTKEERAEEIKRLLGK